MADYEVGYGKPPKKNQFKKGQSGNPQGRKKKSQRKTDMKSLFEEIGNETLMVNGKSLMKKELLINLLYARALKGDERAVYPLLALGKSFNAFEGEKGEPRTGVLVVPGMADDEDEWERQASANQAKYRENTQQGK